ncbi:hypothetical protein EIP91_004352 [Steccherinum ochraceum]|uniref:BTB domain-containing protein n=1 Tax=Steccherinum ochraceum TaxID=92696 RepID=A0A4V2MVY4_9APHY|nr:hypothetical protein EIP91_004352 [Steccherinum ochraceum]
MFSLPSSPPSNSTEYESLDDQDAHTIPVTESSIVIDGLLRLIYPVEDPPLDTLSSIVDVLRTGRKYQVSNAVMHPVSQAFNKLAETQPLQVFATACRFEMEDEAMEAARRALKVQKSMEDSEEKKLTGAYVDEMEHVSAGAYFRLQWYLSVDGKVNDSFKFIRRDVADGTTEPEVESFLKDVESEGDEETTDFDEHALDAYGAFSRLLADLHVQSSIDPSVDFPVHQSILIIHSPVLADEITKPLSIHSDGLPVIHLPIDRDLLHRLLQLCYGALTVLEDPSTYDIDSKMLLRLVEIAKKYDMPRIVDAARVMLRAFLASDPMPAYFVAVACGWSHAAHEAARYAIEVPDIQWEYVAQMEHCPAKAYYNFLRYKTRCEEEVTKIKDRHTAEPDADKGECTVGPVVRYEDNVSTLLHNSLVESPKMNRLKAPGGNRTISETLVQRALDKWKERKGVEGEADAGDVVSDVADLQTENSVMEFLVRRELAKIKLDFDID